MNYPASFKKDGYTSPALSRQRIKLPNGKLLKPLLIGTEGMTDTGKTEFALSIPGWGQMLCIDRAFEGLFDNPHPPECRNPKFAVKVIQIPVQAAGTQKDYVKYYLDCRQAFYDALDNQDSTVVVIDGDSDFWELHILAAFGKLTGIFPQTKYGTPYAEKRAMITRAWDSGKIVLCTNKVKDEYKPVFDDKGAAVMEGTEQKKEKTGEKRRQGFPDQDYLWNIQLRHLYRPTRYNQILKREEPRQWGIQILKCKHNPEMVGSELWGSECNFRGLVDLVYPEVDPAEWGF